MTPYPLGLRPHLALIAVAALLLGASLYARAHARDCKTVGELRALFAANRGGTLCGEGNAMRTVTSAETLELLAAIPDETPLLQTTRYTIANQGGVIGQVWGSASRSRYFNLSLNERGGSANINGDSYYIDYDPPTAAHLKTVVAKLTTPATK